MSKATEDSRAAANNDDPSASQNTTPAPEQNATVRATAGPSRVVGNQARKQDEVTRQGTQKMKFVPTLPARRKKPDEVKQEETPAAPKPTERGRGRGRGLPGGRGRGGPPPPRTEMQMTASGPFAMGPALAGSSKRRAPRSNFTAIMPTGPGSSTIGEGLSSTGPPTLNRDKDKQKSVQVKEEAEDIEVYSDPDDGVQIVDMNAVKTMDWMAPESLGRERDDGKKSKKKKAEAIKQESKGKGKEKANIPGDVDVTEERVEKNLANALDLSGSEEEEEMEDLIDDFAVENLDDEDSFTRQEKLYFFQFPQPFPTFSLPEEREITDVDAMVVDDHKPAIVDPQAKGKKAVSFAPDVKLQASSAQKKDEPQAANPVSPERIDGIIGQLEVHRSGIIKMRLNNGMLMDVTAATQPSFLQHAVSLDPTTKKLHVLGEVNRRFVVSPDVDKMLEELDKTDDAIQPNIDNTTDTN